MKDQFICNLPKNISEFKSLKLNILPILFTVSMIKDIDLNNEITDRINNRNSIFFL